jgi:hypothetical protein
MSSIQGVGHSKIVGAPTFPEWNAGAHTFCIPVLAQAFRTEVFSSGATFAHGTEIPPRDSMVAAETKTPTPSRGELQKSRHAPRAGIMVGHRKNVGAPTFLDSPRVVCP